MKLTELQKYISSYFRISDRDLDTVTELFSVTEMKRDAYFIKTGQYCDRLSFVQSGFIRVFADLGDKEVTQWIATKGYFVTDLNSFIFKQRARWNMQALTDCKLYTIHKDNYTLLHHRIPNWVEVEKQFIASCFVTLEDRVFSHLSLNAEQRYDRLFEHNRELFNQVPLHYLASMLGMSPETFSRIRNKKNS